MSGPVVHRGGHDGNQGLEGAEAHAALLTRRAVAGGGFWVSPFLEPTAPTQTGRALTSRQVTGAEGGCGDRQHRDGHRGQEHGGPDDGAAGDVSAALVVA